MIALLGNLSRDLKPGLPPLTGGGSYHGGRALQRREVQRVIALVPRVSSSTIIAVRSAMGEPRCASQQAAAMLRNSGTSHFHSGNGSKVTSRVSCPAS